MGIGCGFQVGGPLFLKRFSEKFFLKNGAKWSSKCSKMQNKLMENELETKSTKHAENVPNLIPLDLQETRFRMEWLSKMTKTRSVDKYKNSKKMLPK